MTRKEKYYLFIGLIPFFTAILIYFLPKIFEGDSRTDDLIKQRVEAQMPYLITLERLISVAEKTSQLKGTFKYPIETFFNPEGNYSTNDSLTLSPLIPIPAIVSDSNQRKEFFRLVNKIQDGRDTISPKVYTYFEHLTEYLDEYPLPSLDSLSMQNNLWFIKEAVRTEWYQITKNISTAIDNLYTFK